MESHEKKTEVLHQLSTEPHPIGMVELLEKLGPNFSERTVRRWLSELVYEGLVERSGQKRGTKYSVLQRSERNTEGREHLFGPQSKSTIERIHRPLFERKPVSYNEQWLDSYNPNKTWYLPPGMRGRLSKAGQRYSHEVPAGTFAHQVYNRLLIDLSYNSSRLEGNTYSLLDTQKLLIEGESAPGKLEEETVMVLNHKEAIRFLVDNAPRLEITPQTIFTIHYLLSDGLLEPNEAGKVRTHGVQIGGSTYIPIEGQKKLLILLERITDKAALIEDSFEQSLFLLVHLTYLQAFADVNKRTARLSSNIPLIKRNLVPLSFNDVERDDYLSASIAIYEFQDVRPMIDLYAFSYMRTCMLYEATVQSLGVDEVRVRYRQHRRAVIRDIILQRIVGPEIEKFVSLRMSEVAPKDRKNFIDDVLEDLTYIDLSRIAGLGISPDQLQAWLRSAGTRI
jgi:Fic family protein